MALHIRCNNVPRDLTYGYELTEKERKEFDYISAEDMDGHSFVRYRGELYDLSDFMRCEPGGDLDKAGWAGYASDSFFSGTVVKYVDNFERVVIGTYIVKSDS